MSEQAKEKNKIQIADQLFEDYKDGYRCRLCGFELLHCDVTNEWLHSRLSFLGHAIIHLVGQQENLEVSDGD